MEAIIGTDGLVSEARVVRAAHPALEDPALAGIRQWRYKPATREGKPVRVFLTCTLNFNGD